MRCLTVLKRISYEIQYEICKWNPLWKSDEICYWNLLDYMKSYDICEFHEILLISVKSCWDLMDFIKSFEFAGLSSNLVNFRWISDNADYIKIYYRFHLQITKWITLWISLWNSFVDFMDFIWNPLDSIWKTRRKWRISLESVVLIDFRWISLWISWNPTQWY